MKLFDAVSVLSAALPEVPESTGSVGLSDWADMIKEMIGNADPMRFVDSLVYMGVGMLGIFLVMGILIVGTAVLNKITNRKPKNKE